MKTRSICSQIAITIPCAAQRCMFRSSGPKETSNARCVMSVYAYSGVGL